MIFILNDDDGVRDSLRLLLECEGFEAREFASCGEFLDAGRRGDGDCLILDLHMPEMSGIELLERLRRRGETLPVILITGRFDGKIRERAGALAVVEKPYKAAEILNLVRQALGQTKSLSVWPLA
jgi:two-component system response regulator FixJ